MPLKIESRWPVLTPKSNSLPQGTRAEVEEADSAAEMVAETVAEVATVMTDEVAEDTMTDEEAEGTMTDEVVIEVTIDGMTDEAPHDETTTGR